MPPVTRPAIRAHLLLALASLPAFGRAAAQPNAEAPFKAGGYYFYTASNGTLYVRDGKGRNRALLEANTFAMLAPSRNGRYLAYEVLASRTPTGGPPAAGGPPVGAGSYDVRVRDVVSGRDLNDVLHNAIISRAPWTANDKGFFYTLVDTTDQRQRVYYHRVDRPQARDQAIYGRQDSPDWRYDARVSDDGQYAVFTISHVLDAHTRLYFIDLDDPGKPALNAPVVKLVDDFGARYEFIDNGGHAFFLWTDRVTALGEIVLANTDVTRESRWPTVLEAGPDTLEFARTAGNDYVIAVYRAGTMSSARVLGFPSEERMREVIQRRADSARKAGGDSTPRPRPGDRTGPWERAHRDPSPARGDDTFAWPLEVKRTIPVPANSTILDMWSVADGEELFYTAKSPNGAVTAYTYNVKTGQQGVFDTHPATR